MIVFMFPDSVSCFEICFAIHHDRCHCENRPATTAWLWLARIGRCVRIPSKKMVRAQFHQTKLQQFDAIHSLLSIYIYIDRLMTSSNEYFSRTAWFSRNLEVSSRNWIPPGQEWFVSSVRFAVLVGYKKKSMLGLQSQIESVKGSGELQ